VQPSERGNDGEGMVLLMEDNLGEDNGGNTVLIHPSQCFTHRERSERANLSEFEQFCSILRDFWEAFRSNIRHKTNHEAPI